MPTLARAHAVLLVTSLPAGATHSDSSEELTEGSARQLITVASRCPAGCGHWQFLNLMARRDELQAKRERTNSSLICSIANPAARQSTTPCDLAALHASILKYLKRLHNKM